MTRPSINLHNSRKSLQSAYHQVVLLTVGTTGKANSWHALGFKGRSREGGGGKEGRNEAGNLHSGDSEDPAYLRKNVSMKKLFPGVEMSSPDETALFRRKNGLYIPFDIPLVICCCPRQSRREVHGVKLGHSWTTQVKNEEKVNELIRHSSCATTTCRLASLFPRHYLPGKDSMEAARHSLLVAPLVI